jgi:hypothetical protein
MPLDDDRLFPPPKSSLGWLVRIMLGLGATILCLPGMNYVLDLISGRHQSVWWLVAGACGGAIWFVITLPPAEGKR